MNDELRCRVTIDRDLPDLYARLAGSKRLAREVVHLMRVGLQWEMLMNGRLTVAAPVVGEHLTVSQAAITSEVHGAKIDADVMSTGKDVDKFLEVTGLTVDYFSGPPSNFVP